MKHKIFGLFDDELEGEGEINSSCDDMGYNQNN